jgi:oligopeptide transport system substrate-binding protein
MVPSPVRIDMKIVGILLAFLGMVLVLTLVFRYPPASKTSSPEGKVFRMNLISEPPTLDWSLATDSVSITVIENLMEGLTRYDEKLQPQPAIAKKWEVSRDGKTYRFYLREDVRWTDGHPVTAEEFEYSWKRLLDPKTAAEYAYFLYDLVNGYEYNTGQIKDASQVGVKALGPWILEVNLKKPIVYFPTLTTFTVTFPQRKDLIERYGDHWTDPDYLITNGPYQLKQWKHEYKLVLAANRDYFNGRPQVDRVLMFVVNEPTTALTLYETGDLDVDVRLPPEAIPFYQDNPQFHRIPVLRGYYYGFNVTKSPFRDARVRKTFSLAIDREELSQILKGGEVPTTSWIPPGMFAYNSEIGLKYDPTQAKQLLAQAGYPGGDKFPPVTVMYDTNPINNLIAENLQAQWQRNLNVRVNLENQEWKVFLKRLKTDTPMIFRLGWGADYPDPDNFMALFATHSGNNNTHWSHPHYDELIAEAASEPDPNQRQRMYDEAQRILTEQEVPMMPLFAGVQNILIKPYVQGLEFNAMEILSLRKVYFADPSLAEATP